MNSSIQVSKESKMNMLISKTNQIPKKLFFELGSDIVKVKRFLQYLDSKSDKMQSFDDDQLIRAVIAKQLRIVNMKVTDIKILLLVGLKNITRSDLDLSENVIVDKLIQENLEKYDLDILSRIVSQIRTKLPSDLSARLTPDHNINIKNIIVGNLHSKQSELLERFSNIYEYNLKDVDTPEELSEFHMELEKHREDTSYHALEENLNKIPKELEQKISDFQMELEKYAGQDTSYHAQEERHLKKKHDELEQELIRATDLEHINTAREEKINAHYVEREPILAEDPEHKKMYHYDEHSKTLKRLPNKDELHKVSIDQMEKILKSHDISEADLKKTIKYLQDDKVLDEDVSKFIINNYRDPALENVIVEEEEEDVELSLLKDSNKLMKNLFIGLGIFLIVVIVIAFIFKKRRK